MLKLRDYGISIDPVWISRDNRIIKYTVNGSIKFNKNNISAGEATFKRAVNYFRPLNFKLILS